MELDIYGETAKLRILEKLFQYPEREFTLSELALEAGVAKQNMQKIINGLQKNKLIETARLGKRMWLIKGKQDELKFIKQKIIYNLNIIYKSGIIEILEDIFDRPKSIILFGSFRYGKDISTSDIDIAVETPLVDKYSIVKSNDKTSKKNESELIKKIENKIGRKFEFHLFPKLDLSDKDFKETFVSIINGFVFYGFLDLKHEKGKKSVIR